MPNFNEDMKRFQLELSRHQQQVKHEMAHIRRIRYFELAGACFLAGGYLLMAYAWGCWPW